MRISTGQFQALAVSAILDQQSKLTKTQQQLSSGLRFTSPSEDPVGAGQMITLQKTLDITKQYQANATAATNRLSLEENVLSGVTNILQRAREITVDAAKATHSNDTRGFLATELRQLISEALGLANTKDGNGEYLFSGSMGTTQPFAANGAGGYSYFGDQTQRMVQISSSRTIADADSGSQVFEQVRNGNGTFVTAPNPANTGTGVIGPGSVVGAFTPALTAGVNGYTLRFAVVAGVTTWEVFDSGNPQPAPHPTPVATGTYTAGAAIQFNGASVIFDGTPANGDTFTIKSSENQSVFNTLAAIATVLETPINSAAQTAALQNSFNSALTDIDQSLSNILVVRASVGTRLNAIDDQKGVNESFSLQTTQTLSSIKDLDYASAISQLNIQTAEMSAAQQSYLKVQGLSMFNYLK